MKNTSLYFKVAPGVWGMKILFVNVYMVVSNDHWILIDAGLVGSGKRIRRMAQDLFDNTPPAAILLTHGHFDHRGALEDLLQTWNVPVYAHRLELPYLTGQSAYPPPDPSVGGGLMSLMSFLYPKRPINLGRHIHQLPADGSVPYLPEWSAIFSPGHSPGQVAFFRENDRLLIAGDAFVTTKQESAVATLSSKRILSGPPKYFTYDWDTAKATVIQLQRLLPKKAATGHGPPMFGKPLADGLQQLVENFDQQARPKQGRYVDSPAITNDTGVVKLPPNKLVPLALAVAVIAGIGFYQLVKRSRQSVNMDTY